MAYSGNPLLASDLLFRPVHSLIDQSQHSRMGATTTNGDGFGIGWYGEGPRPAVFKSIEPAWNDRNLQEVSAQVRTRLLFAHIRASTGTPVQRSNCHPFRFGNWMWMHNGSIAGFHELKRDMLVAVDPSLYPDIEGSTDSEALFFLALTFGLVDDPRDRRRRAVGFVERLAAERGVVSPVQMTVATSDGESVWAFRYSSEGRVAHAVLLHGRRPAAADPPRAGGAAPARRRGPARRLRAAPRPGRRLERGARVVVRRRAARRGPVPAVRAGSLTGQSEPPAGKGVRPLRGCPVDWAG